jgi:hypothetical protein
MVVPRRFAKDFRRWRSDYERVRTAVSEDGQPQSRKESYMNLYRFWLVIAAMLAAFPLIAAAEEGQVHAGPPDESVTHVPQAPVSGALLQVTRNRGGDAGVAAGTEPSDRASRYFAAFDFAPGIALSATPAGAGGLSLP